MSKSTSILAAITALNLLGVGIPALADDGSGDPTDRRAELLDAYDADGDGRLSGTELDDFREVRGEKRGQRHAKMLDRHDADGDGKLSDDERKEARKGRKLERWDTDGDGILSHDERAAGRDERARKHEANLEKYDSDGDGRLGRSERDAARADGAKLGRRGAKRHGRRHGDDRHGGPGPPGDGQ